MVSLLQEIEQCLYCTMESTNSNEKAAEQKPNPAPAAKKAAPKKLPSKQISFSSQSTNKKGGQGGKTSINSTKKGGVNLMKKLSGM